MIEIINELNAIHREVGKRQIGEDDGIGVLLRRSYGTPIEDVWDALTNPERVKRWLLPVSGDLHVGGAYQLEGGAGGEILQCEPPRFLQVTWGGPTSLVELKLAADGDGDTTLELRHTVPLELAGSGAGALYVGPGWDVTLLGLGLFLREEVVDDPVAWENSLEVQDFSKHTIQAWAAAIDVSGTATTEEIAAAAEAARAQFTPDLVAAPE